MKLDELIRWTIYKLANYYQKFQVLILSLFIVGIADYFILYEIFVSLSAFTPFLLLEISPVIIIVLSVIIIRGAIQSYKKMKENKHVLIF